MHYVGTITNCIIISSKYYAFKYKTVSTMQHITLDHKRN